jgi:hypothetical protein
MLVIRREQMAVFARHMEERLASETIAYLFQDHPDLVEDLPEAILRRRVDQGLRQAREYGFHFDQTLQAFVALMFEFGPHFDRHPVVAKLLRDPDRPADERLDALDVEASDRVWEEIAILSAGDSWADEDGKAERGDAE